jgi:hypothetical protein
VAPAVPVVKPRNLTELQRARMFISETLSGELMLTTTVEELAVEAKVCKRTLRRVAKAMKVRGVKESVGRGSGVLSKPRWQRAKMPRRPAKYAPPIPGRT